MRVSAALPRPRIKMPRSGLAPIVAVLLILGLIAAIAVEPARQLLAQRDRINGMSSELEELTATNRALEERIDRLRDPDYLEQEAREVGLVRPGETAYVVMPPGRKARLAKQKKRRARSAPPPAPPEPNFVDQLLTFMGLG
jgi:cell division protein FtsB